MKYIIYVLFVSSFLSFAMVALTEARSTGLIDAAGNSIDSDTITVQDFVRLQ